MRRTLRIEGPPSSRSGPLVVGRMGYSVGCGLCRRTHLMCHIVCPILAIHRIGVVVHLAQTWIW